MRDDEAFIGELRTEINQSQQRRHEYVAAKLIFISGLLGLGSLSLDSMTTRQLLFIVPFVAFAYDLYILGEDYGIRRAGSFIRRSRVTPPQEVLWEELVRSKKDPFSFIAGPLSSAIALLVAAIGLCPPATNVVIYSSWLTLSVGLPISLWYFRHKFVGKLIEWEEEITERQKGQRESAEGSQAEKEQPPNPRLPADA